MPLLDILNQTPSVIPTKSVKTASSVPVKTDTGTRDSINETLAGIYGDSSIPEDAK